MRELVQQVNSNPEGPPTFLEKNNPTRLQPQAPSWAWGRAEAELRQSWGYVEVLSMRSSPRSAFPAAEDSCHLYQAHLNQLEIRNESCYIQRISRNLQRIAGRDQKHITVLTLDIQTIWFGVSLQGYVPGMVALPSGPIRKESTCPVSINQVNTGKPVWLFQPLRVRLTL